MKAGKKEMKRKRMQVLPEATLNGIYISIWVSEPAWVILFLYFIYFSIILVYLYISWLLFKLIYSHIFQSFYINEGLFFHSVHHCMLNIN